MLDYFPVSHNRKFPEPAPEPEDLDEPAQDAIVDVVLNVYRERNNSQCIAIKISFRLPNTA
jgi:hypothetical protein